MRGRPKKTRTGDVVLVEWEDTVCLQRWADLTEVVDISNEANSLINTVGYFIYEDELGIIVSSSINPNLSRIDNSYRVPKKMIKKITVLQRGR